ncbi:MAG: hypothetical protein QM731_03860 [Chitinophagaceae bacterium]
MLILHGYRTAKIKSFTDHSECCTSCKDFNLSIKVFRKYYHLFFIPLFTYGPKKVSIECNSCGFFTLNEGLQQKYAKMARAPFYFYSCFILIGILILSLWFYNDHRDKDARVFIKDPHIGDVYGVKSQSGGKDAYSFLRVSAVNGDTVFAYHTKYEYDGFISDLQDDDYFVKNEEVGFLKKELQSMLQKGEIHSVDRDYDESSGFNRLK